MKFTKEEISLCKQIAEKHRKEIKYGDWYLEQPMLFLEGDKTEARRIVSLCKNEKAREQGIVTNATPLWTISDCLEFIRESGLYLLGLEQSDDYQFSCGFCETDDIGMRLNLETAKWADGDTIPEACLKAVLAVLEEKQ